MAMVVEDSGVQFDPRIVEVMVSQQAAFDRLRLELSDEVQAA